MNKDENIATPSADAAERWLRERNRGKGESIGEVDPQRQRKDIEDLFSLGFQIVGIAQNIDWEKRDREEEIIRGLPRITCYTESDRVKFLNLDFRDRTVDMQLDGYEIKSIQFMNKGFYWLDWAKQYLGDTPAYGIALNSHEPGQGHKYTYVFTEEGDCVRRASFSIWNGQSVNHEYTTIIAPEEIEKVGVTMKMLKAQLEEFSPLRK